MDLSETLVVFLSYLAAFLATTLALVTWQRASFHWARPFAVMMLALAQWSLTLALELSSLAPETIRAWRMLQIVGSTIMPVAWFVFAARYSGREILVSRARRRLLYTVPVITVVLAFSSARHGYLWRSWTTIAGSEQVAVSYGIWHSLQLLYSVTLAIAGAALLWRTIWQAPPEQRWHTVVITFGAALPVFGYLLQVLDSSLTGDVNVLPYFLLLGVSSLAWTVRHQQIFELVPIARQTVLNNMPDGVIVMNNQDRVVEINPAAEKIIGRSAADVLGQRIVEVAPEWSDLWYEAVIRGETNTEVRLPMDGDERFYDLRFSPVYARAGCLTGRLIILRDITEHKETERELIARRQLFENLVAVARATAEDASLQATLQNALDVTTGLTGAEYSSLFLLDSGGRVTHSILARGQTAPGSRQRIVGTVMDRGLAGWVVRHRKPALVPNTSEDNRWVTFPDQPYTARSVLVVPITSGSDVPGVLTLQHSQTGFFDEDDVALLQAASDQMALALHKAQLFEEQLLLARRQQTLYEALKTVGRHLEPETVVHLATETIARLTGWSAVGIVVPGKGDDHLVLEAACGVLAEREGSSFHVGSGQLGRAYMNGQTLMRLGAFESKDHQEELTCLRSAIFVPLQHAHRRLGLLLVGMEEPAAFNEEDVLLAESLAETVALAMTNAHLFQVVADEHSRLEALIESSRDGIILVGNRRQILFLNRMGIKLLGVRGEPEDWMYRPLVELFAATGDEGEPLMRIAEGGPVRSEGDDRLEEEGEVEIRKRSLRWQNLPVRTESATLGRLVVLEDISKERALQRMREDLTHTMVHDLRNPLSVVAGALEMMPAKMPVLQADARHLLQIAQNSTKRMLHLVNGILNISRLESGNVPLQRRSLDLQELVDQVLDAQHPLAQEKDLRLEHTVNGGKPKSVPAVYADEEMVERVLQNLLGNAIKFTPPGGSVSVQVALEEGAEMVWVAVQDSGPGIAEDIREQLFEKFVTGLQPGKGSGLGLAFCRMAVQAHGGQIWVESEPGRGATFLFTLPLVDRKRA